MRVRYRREALDDLISIHEYIRREDPRVATAVVSRIEQAITRLALFPNSGRPGALAETRELVVPGLPYIVVYQVTSDAATIVAIFHGAQDRAR